jgi:sugar lactone lactonase YvrE
MSLYFGTLAGSGTAGRANGTGTAATFDNPIGIAVDASGNVFVAEYNNNTIRKVTSAGVVTTFAGSTSGTSGSTDDTGSAARFYYPSGVAIDASGNIYVADNNNHTIRKITTAGVVTTFAGTARSRGSTDGTGSAARFSNPGGVATDMLGNVYVADTANHIIRKINNGGEVTTIAGTAGLSGSTDGAGSAARFRNPFDLAVDGSGNVFVADTDNHVIRKITSDGIVSTIAGTAGLSGSTDGTGLSARFNSPNSIAIDSAGNIFVADSVNHTVRKIINGNVVTTEGGLAGSSGSANGTGSAARFYFPKGITVASAGNIFVSEAAGNRIRFSRGTADITLSSLYKVYTGSSQAPTTTVSPSGLTLELTYSGTATSLSAPITVGSYVVTASVVDNFFYGVTRGVLVISKASQTISFASIPTKAVGSTPFTVSPSASSGDTVSLSSSNTSVATVSGFTISPLSAGTTTISATQAGNDNYLAATTVTQILSVSSAIASVVLSGLTKNYTGSAQVPTTTVSPAGLTVQLTYSGTAASLSAPINAGSYVVTASVVDNNYYGSASGVITISPAAASLALSNLSKTYTGLGQVPSTTVSPLGIAVQLTYAGTAASLSAPITAGSYVVTASVVDNNYYGSTSGVITISKASQIITFPTVPTKTAGSGAFTVAPSSTSNLTVALSSSNTAVATVSGFSISPVGAGTSNISAAQAGDTNYLAATTVTQVFAVTTAPVAQTISFAPLSARRVTPEKDIYAAALLIASSTSLSFADATSVAQANAKSTGSFALVATASSGLPVTFTSTATAVATIIGNICTPIASGATNIVASQAGSSSYSAATSVTQSLVVIEKQFAWLDLRWDLTDLQINASTRVVSSSKESGTTLTIRQGDAHDIAVFFTDPAGAAILMSPSALKLCIREKTNRRPVLIETTTFTPTDFGGFDPYYQISFTANNDSIQRFVAFNGVDDNSDAIPAIGEIEWIYGGKVYSSKPFTVKIVPEIERTISDV